MIDARKRDVDGVTVLDISGTLDMDGFNLLKEKLQEVRQSGSVKIVLNLERLHSVQSTVLDGMLTPIRALTMMKGKIALTTMNESVHRVMKTSRFYEHVIVADSVEEAVADLNV
ncbi:MAG: STAS domain-containing protein [Candidatus Hinthialibacter antarcticus]|nr:STAS domain-containing protein [Candidatus Hinthialibacter antarcticus]